MSNPFFSKSILVKTNERFKRRKFMFSLIGVAVGGLLGFSYYRLVGCSTGACLITSNPWISTLYGAAMGFLISHS